MNRLLNVFQHAAIAHATKKSLSSSPSCANSFSPLPALTALVHGSWLSTAVATPGADDLQPGAPAAEPTASSTPQLPGGRQHAASAGPPFSPHPAPAPSPAPAPLTSLAAAAQPQPAALPEQDEGPPPPIVAVFEDEALAAALRTPPPVQLLQVVPTPEGAPRDKLLVRDFIQNSLYHPTLGYFNAPTPPVGSMGSPINYWRIYCRDEFNILVGKKYLELESSFLTPAELFSPWYGACIARHMVEHRRHHLAMEGQPLWIVEVGGGNGTLARDILDWLRDNRPQEYRQTSYTCLEISTSLAARQYDKVVRQGGHGGRFHLRRGSGLDPATWGSERRWEHTFVLMMEVLDNLPHDRVFRRRASEPWQQTAVRPTTTTTTTTTPTTTTTGGGGGPTLESGPWELVGEALGDGLVRRTLKAVYRAPSREQQLDDRFNRVLDFILARDAQPASRDEVLWLPTACAAFLELLHNLRPNHSLIAADFDKLPDVRLPGRNAPLVAQKVGGRNTDHDTLLLPWGTADIFFPTDFDALCALYRTTAEHVWGAEGRAAGGAAGGGAAADEAGGPAATAAAVEPPPPPPGTAPVVAAGPVAAAEAGTGICGGNMGDVNAEHFRQGAVVKRYREMFNTATICAFNPMVDDFVNARFFFGDSKNRYPPGQARPVLQPSKHRLPQAPLSMITNIKAHIPAASAASVRARLQQQQQQGQGHGQQYQQGQQQGKSVEPVLGGRRHRGGLDSSSSGGGSSNNSSGGGGGGRGRGPPRR